MRFCLIDRITDIEPGRSIKATKCLTLAEEYLQDHFPLFPVLPGVLMLEALFQTSAWLVRESEDFANSVVLLKEARNVKYGNFVKPGQMLVIEAQIIKQDEATTTLKTQAQVDQSSAVSARLILERFNLADRHPQRTETDSLIRRGLREQFAVLYPHSSQKEQDENRTEA